MLKLRFAYLSTNNNNNNNNSAEHASLFDSNSHIVVVSL